MTPEEEAAAAAAEVEKKEKEAQVEATKKRDRDEVISEIDAKIAARDQALLETIKAMLQPPKEQPKPVEQPPAEVSSEDFWRDPNAALNKFFAAKVEPALKASRAAETEDTSGLEALVATRKMELKDAVGDEDWKKYGRFFEQISTKTDPKVLKEALGMDAVWRLAKSYGDDAIHKEEETRHARNTDASLQVGGGGPKIVEQKVTLNEDEAKAAEAMGMSPELYKKYSKVEEVEIGADRKKK